jgi:hypothetical protein
MQGLAYHIPLMFFFVYCIELVKIRKLYRHGNRIRSEEVRVRDERNAHDVLSLFFQEKKYEMVNCALKYGATRPPAYPDESGFHTYTKEKTCICMPEERGGISENGILCTYHNAFLYTSSYL